MSETDGSRGANGAASEQLVNGQLGAWASDDWNTALVAGALGDKHLAEGRGERLTIPAPFPGRVAHG